MRLPNDEVEKIAKSLDALFKLVTIEIMEKAEKIDIDTLQMSDVTVKLSLPSMLIEAAGKVFPAKTDFDKLFSMLLTFYMSNGMRDVMHRLRRDPKAQIRDFEKCCKKD